MRNKRKIVAAVLLGLLGTLVFSFVLALFSFGGNFREPRLKFPSENEDDPQTWEDHQLAVIVPFRDRFDELLQFAPYMHKFLNKQGIKHRIFVVNQVDQHRFNRGSLINVGFLISSPHCDYITMHDVDLLPLNPELKYTYPHAGPVHLASPEYHPKYHYPSFVGGIIVINNEQFKRLNGLSNKYWGWGLEDDEFYARMKDAKLNITRPRSLKTGVHNTFMHMHDKKHRPRDTARLHNQRQETRKRDRITGLNNVQYEMVGQNSLTINGAPVEVYNVKLVCNYTLTPWCSRQMPDKKKPSSPPQPR